MNTALAAGSLTASLDSSNKLVITTTNDAASSTIGAVTVGGTAGSATFGAVVPPVADPVSQATRASLVAQYNQILTQITTTAQDASFNGINLLNGDSLKLVFDETGKSTSTINGVTFNPAGLGLKALTAGTDFLDNSSTNTVLTALNTASTTLRSQASASRTSSVAPTSSTTPPPTRSSQAFLPRAPRCGRKLRRSVRTSRSCRSVRTSPRT